MAERKPVPMSYVDGAMCDGCHAYPRTELGEIDLTNLCARQLRGLGTSAINGMLQGKDPAKVSRAHEITAVHATINSHERACLAQLGARLVPLTVSLINELGQADYISAERELDVMFLERSVGVVVHAND